MFRRTLITYETKITLCTQERQQVGRYLCFIIDSTLNYGLYGAIIQKLMYYLYNPIRPDKCQYRNSVKLRLYDLLRLYNDVTFAIRANDSDNI